MENRSFRLKIDVKMAEKWFSGVKSRWLGGLKSLLLLLMASVNGVVVVR